MGYVGCVAYVAEKTSNLDCYEPASNTWETPKSHQTPFGDSTPWNYDQLFKHLRAMVNWLLTLQLQSKHLRTMIVVEVFTKQSGVLWFSKRLDLGPSRSNGGDLRG